ncbi:DnaJ domain-containing protein [bacterium]|nr:DnaJ domain-containing protein [bacterium]
MSLFHRIKNIIRSNINFPGAEDINVEMDSYDDIYYDDLKVVNNETNSLEKKYYKVLELEYGDNFDKIKRNYKRLLKKYHPDLFQNKPEKLETAQKVTKEINEAYTYFERKFL